METLEKAIRGASNLGKLNLFRSRSRGGWEASATRLGSETSFVVGIDADPATAVLKALQALGRSSGAAAVAEVSKSAAESYSKGVFG